MPELPEVETIRTQLDKYVGGCTISGIDIKNPKYSVEKTKVIGAKITGVRRFGKVLSVDLSNGISVVIHIKLTGQLIYRGPKLKSIALSKKVIGGVPGPHTHLIFNLGDCGKLYYNDVRRFGWVKVVKTGEIKTFDFVSKLGPEPLVVGSKKPLDVLALGKFKKILSKTKRPIKIVLMDQEKMSGVGNIYANDALWLAGINPKTEANNLGLGEQSKLFISIIKVLKEGIKRGGASELAFVTPDGKEGKYQDFTLVYGREGKRCKKCGAVIKKTQLGGRGTYFCSHCQTK